MIAGVLKRVHKNNNNCGYNQSGKTDKEKIESIFQNITLERSDTK